MNVIVFYYIVIDEQLAAKAKPGQAVHLRYRQFIDTVYF